MSRNNDFRELGLSEPILKALNEMGFEEPTEVQQKAIPHILNGEDVIVMSKTGSGKTAVFGVSLLQMTDPEKPGPQCLILEPTRELAVQVDNDLKKMANHLQHHTTAVYGQHNMNKEIQALKSSISIVTGTPGRIYDHIQHKNLITKNIHFLVLDEVDRMMDMGFIGQVRRILRTLPRNRTTLLFSATIPGEIRRLCSSYMNHPVTIELESKTMTVDTIGQRYYRVQRNEKRTQLNRILLMERPETCMIFCNTRAAVDRVQNFLIRKGYDCRSLHGDIPQAKRMRNIQQFKRREYNILVATDVAARGIDIDNLSLVINYDVPEELDGYVHRIGRTGRAGHDGHAISLVTGEDIMTLYEIEEHIGALIVETELPTDQDLAECREESSRWIQSNRIKSHPAPASKSKGGRKKPSRSPSPQRPHRPKSRQDASKHRSSPQKPARQASSHSSTGSPSSTHSPYQQGQAHEAKETAPDKKPIENPGQGEAHPSAPDKTDNGSAFKKPQGKSSGAPKSSARTQQQAAETQKKTAGPQQKTVGKSFLRRITGRLFGK